MKAVVNALGPCACGSGKVGRICHEFDVEEAKSTCVMWQHSHARCTCEDPVCSQMHPAPWLLTRQPNRVICSGYLAWSCCLPSLTLRYVLEDSLRSLTYAVKQPDAVLYEAQKCKRHKPDGCFNYEEGEPKLRCPQCLIFPIMCLLHKITNHLELIKGAHAWPSTRSRPC